MSSMMRGTMRAVTLCRFAQVTSCRESRAAASMLLQSRSFQSTSQTFASDSIDHAPSSGGRGTNTFEKRMLVWAKIYPSIEEVPELVTQEKVKKAKDWFRIRTANVMIFLFLFGSYWMMKWGDEDRKAGDSLHVRGLAYHDHHTQLGKEKRARDAEAAAAAAEAASNGSD